MLSIAGRDADDALGRWFLFALHKPAPHAVRAQLVGVGEPKAQVGETILTFWCETHGRFRMRLSEFETFWVAAGRCEEV